MATKDEIDGIGIKIEAEGLDRLFVLVCKDGTINRCGSGKMSDTKDTVYIGTTQEPIFERVMARIDERIFQHVGKEISMNNQKGIACKLTVHFKKGDLGNHFIIHYGHLSGYPADAASAVKALYEETQSWYEHHKAEVEKINRQAGGGLA